MYLWSFILLKDYVDMYVWTTICELLIGTNTESIGWWIHCFRIFKHIIKIWICFNYPNYELCCMYLFIPNNLNACTYSCQQFIRSILHPNMSIFIWCWYITFCYCKESQVTVIYSSSKTWNLKLAYFLAYVITRLVILKSYIPCENITICV